MLQILSVDVAAVRWLSPALPCVAPTAWGRPADGGRALVV